jgi:hypothetical protein
MSDPEGANRDNDPLTSFALLDEQWDLQCEGAVAEPCEYEAVWVFTQETPCCPQFPPYWLACASHALGLAQMNVGTCVYCQKLFRPGIAAWSDVQLLNPDTGDAT